MVVIARVAIVLFVVIAGCSGDSDASCVPGSTQACLCVGGASGVQACRSGGTFGACDCGGGPGMDAGGTDAGTGEVDAGVDALPGLDGGPVPDTGMSTCPAPFVVCAGDCVDPRSNPDHCGASGDCTGAAAGTICGGQCRGGRCAEYSCADILMLGRSTGDGLYFVDVDSMGPTAPQDVYCDMTTDGGGWTLVYKIRNDVPDIADPWYGMVGVGTGDGFPTAPTPVPAGSHFEGPTLEARRAYNGHSSAADYRATLLDGSGAQLMDVVCTGFVGGVASGRSPSLGCAGCTALATIGDLTVGDTGMECYRDDSGFSYDTFITDRGHAICGDAGGGPGAATTTLFWIR